MKNIGLKKSKATNEKAVVSIDKWLKEFQILFNLSTELNKSQIQQLQSKFMEIVNSK